MFGGNSSMIIYFSILGDGKPSLGIVAFKAEINMSQQLNFLASFVWVSRRHIQGHRVLISPILYIIILFHYHPLN